MTTTDHPHVGGILVGLVDKKCNSNLIVRKEAVCKRWPALLEFHSVISAVGRRYCVSAPREGLHLSAMNCKGDYLCEVHFLALAHIMDRYCLTFRHVD